MNTNVSSVAQEVVISAPVVKLVSDFRDFASKTAQGILEMARVVYEAKKLGKKEFKVFCQEIGYEASSSTIRKLNSIGEKYAFLKNHKNALPSSWTTIYQISRLTEEVIQSKIEEGVITPTLDGKGVTVALGLAEQPIKNSVPNGTPAQLSFSVEFDMLLPSGKLKEKILAFLAELEETAKAKITKSASLEKFLDDNESIQEAA